MVLAAVRSAHGRNHVPAIADNIVLNENGFAKKELR